MKKMTKKNLNGREFCEELEKAFPNLYRKVDNRFCYTLFGVECGPGWYDIIWDLSEKIEAEIMKLPEKDRKNVYIHQIKEKFGGLRFYMSCETDEMFDLIQKAEEKAYKTCEICGAPAELKDNRAWWQTICDECDNKQMIRRGQTT
jgi:hypothetical protein